VDKINSKFVITVSNLLKFSQFDIF